MIIHPELRALRGDDSPQRLAQGVLFDAVAAWRAQPQVAALLAGLDDYAAGAGLETCAPLAGLFQDGGESGLELARGFAAASCEGLKRAPLGHMPLRHFTDGVLSTLLLARSGNVTLSLVAVDGDGLRERPAPVSVSFAPGESREIVLAGTASAELVSCGPLVDGRAKLDRQTVALERGMRSEIDAARQTLLLHEVDGCLVTLRLQRRVTHSAVAREFALADGALVHQAAGNPRDSRIELMIALLGRMERADAAPQIAAIACEEGSAPLRWQALRECLALDTAAGFAALTSVARSATDELAAPAGALRSQLVEAYPQLAEIEPCPA